MALALRVVDVWKKKGKKKERDGDAGTEKEKSGGGEERYTEELVERKEALWNGRSLGLAQGQAGDRRDSRHVSITVGNIQAAATVWIPANSNTLLTYTV